MMLNSTHLPDGYGEILSIDLQKDKKLALIVNIIGAAILVVMVIPALFFVPIRTLFDMSAGIGMYFLRFAVLLVGLIAYIILHEIVHGIFMKHFSGIKPNYGFTGLYAYAGSSAYFNKKSYIIIALAPVVIWGVVLLILNCVVPVSWFWIIYIIQCTNISGAAGDIYVVNRFSKLPSNILVNDTGVSMTVFSII